MTPKIYNVGKTIIPKAEILKLENKTVNSIISKRPVNFVAFSCQLHDIGRAFQARNEVPCLNKHAKRFAQRLVNLGDSNLAGIVYSLLIKLNAGNPEIVEQIATAALAIAKRFHDPVHIMARANDLKEIYKITKPASREHLNALLTERRALSQICTDYDKVQKRFMSLSRKMKPIKGYELKLAAVRYEIAEIMYKSDKNAAREHLLAAREIVQKYQQGNLFRKIENLLREIDK